MHVRVFGEARRVTRHGEALAEEVGRHARAHDPEACHADARSLCATHWAWTLPELPRRRRPLERVELQPRRPLRLRK